MSAQERLTLVNLYIAMLAERSTGGLFPSQVLMLSRHVNDITENNETVIRRIRSEINRHEQYKQAQRSANSATKS